MAQRGTVVRAVSVVAGFLIIVALCLVVWLAVPLRPRSTASLTFDGYILLPRPRLLNVLDYVSIYGPTLFVTSITNGDVYAVSLGSGDPAAARVSTVPGQGQAHGVVIDPVSHLAFVTRSGANHVDIFDPASLQTVRHIAVADDPDGIFYLSDQKLVYAASGGSMTATLIDPARQAVMGTVPLGGKPEFAVDDPAARLVYQNLESQDAIAVVDSATRSVRERWPLEGCKGPSSMAADLEAHRLFVVCSGNARLVVLDLATHRIVASVPVGGGPDAVAFDPALRRLYVAGLGGWLDVIGQDAPDSYRALDRIRTHFGAHTLGLDLATHKVYVAYASLGTAPRLAVFTPTPSR